jgi:hypothetical protein
MPDVKATTLTITMIAESNFTSLNIDAPPVGCAMRCYCTFGYDSPINVTAMMGAGERPPYPADLSLFVQETLSNLTLQERSKAGGSPTRKWGRFTDAMLQTEFRHSIADGKFLRGQNMICCGVCCRQRVSRCLYFLDNWLKRARFCFGLD